MQIIVKSPDGARAQVLTKKQFDIVHDYIVACMNGGKKIKDTEIYDRLLRTEHPLNFQSSILLEVALYEDQPVIAFLGGWLGSDVEDNQDLYTMTRELLTDAELTEFDLRTDEETQRTFLMLVSLSNGAYML